MRERERESEGIYEREKVNKKIIKFFETCYSVVSFMKPHCSMLQKNLRFGTSHEPWILMFGVSNAKYLTFDTLDSNALSH